MTEITWYGHAAFKISGSGVTLLIDPFLSANPVCPVTPQDVGTPDAVFVTHDHGDHVGDTVAICKNTGAMLGCIVGTARRLVEEGVPASQILNGIGFNMGGTLSVKGAQITMVPAFHTAESGQPAGYIIRMPDGFTVYHAGDTCLFGDMAVWGRLFSLDVALLPIGDVFTMDPLQAAEASALLRPAYVIPMHWKTFPALVQNMDSFAAALKRADPACKMLTLDPGESVRL